MTNHTIMTLSSLAARLPVGANLALLHFVWMLVSGVLLSSRGALFPALKSIGLSDEAAGRAWAAFRKGVWLILALWQEHVMGRPGWQEHRYEGYRAVPADVTAFWRLALKNCPSKHFHPGANRALPAVLLGITGVAGEINGQRRALERVPPKDASEKRLWQEILKNANKSLQDDEILVVDAGVKLNLLREFEIERYVARLATNFTARRNFLPERTKGRKPTCGALVRPLARKHKQKILEAAAPDETYAWSENGVELRAEIWRDLVLPGNSPGQTNKTVDVYAIYDPRFEGPWLLAVPLKLKPESARSLYKDRWPVEQIPDSARQMVGSRRQFVHAPESIQRLPELALLAGSILSFLAATMPAIPTGFWDCKPKRTPGRLRRALFGKPFPKDATLPGQLREKKSVTAHLLKGNLARSPKTAASLPK